MRFADPLWLLLLLIVPIELWMRWPRLARAPRTSIGYPVVALLGPSARGGRSRWASLPLALRSLGLALLVLAMGRPQTEGEVHDRDVKGRNIMLTLDISSSMKALDFKTGNRLEAAKQVMVDFINRRQGDFMGMVVFAGRGFTQAPLTNDRGVLLDLLDRAEIGMLPDGTAIGTALAMSENHLKDLPRGSGVVLLITDGGNNTGTPDPVTAAEAARALGIRIYTIGVSSQGRTAIAPYKTGRPSTMEVPSALSSADERTLRRIASISGGRYYRAMDAGTLSDVMHDIDQLEKSELRLHEVRNYREWFVALVIPAAALLSLALWLRAGKLRTLP